MDIRRWLEETVQPELLLSLPEQPAVAASNPKLPDLVSKRGRKRAKSDSSLLDPLRDRTPTGKQKPTTEASADHNAGSEASHPTHSEPTDSDVSSRRYARRPRRKTRPGRYESSSKAARERGKHASQSRKSESKPLQRKSKHKKCEKPRSGIVQCFHAKNVSGDRLTLKPREQLGLFNKGKTSMAVKGRGLPDLVFSEMKFLQQQKDQPEPGAQAGLPNKKRKSDDKHGKEGEISAFFTSVRPVLAEQDVNHQREEVPQPHATLLEPNRRERERSAVVEIPNPTVPTSALHDKASYLGFRSRGSHHESTSVVSWSESVRAPSTQSALPRTSHVSCSSPLDLVNGRKKGRTIEKEATPFRRPATLSLPQRTADETTGRFEVSSMAPSRSQSYRRPRSLPQRTSRVDRAAKFRNTDTIDSPSSMPLVAPVRANVDTMQVQATDNDKAFLSGTSAISPYRQPMFPSEGPDVDVIPQTSSDLGRVLQQCNVTFHERRRVVTPRRRHTVPEIPSELAHEEERQASTTSYPTTHRIPTVRFGGVEYRAPPLPSLAGPSIYQQQAQRQQILLQPAVGEHFINDMDVMRECFGEPEDMGLAHQSWEKSPDDTGCYGIGQDTGTHVEDESSETEDAADQLLLENNVVAPGFWRPNRLY